MSSVKTAASPSSLAIISALGAVYVFWGGTYLGMRFAVETLPPFLMAGTRFLFAGLLMFCFDLSRGNSLPSLKQWCEAGIVGALLLLGGNGCVVWATQIVPSGLSAIIVATVPLWMALFVWLFPGGERPNRSVLFGLLLGFSGILLLVAQNTSPAVSAGFSQWAGYIALATASISWSLGSIYARRASLPKSPWMAISLQMITGGTLLLAAGIIAGEWTTLSLNQVSTRSLLAFAYLIVFGSLIGFSSYIWLLQNTRPALVSTYAYVNPVIAVFLGWALANEQFSSTDMAAAAVVVVAVAIITRGSGRRLPVSKS